MKLFRKRRSAEFSCSVVVVAAGSSSRMGKDKILADLGGVPVLIHSLRTFQSMEEVSEIVVVTRENLIPEIADLCRIHRLDKVSQVVRGGSSRLESSRIGTLHVRSDCSLIAIHDGARPLIPADVARSTMAKAAETGAAAPAVPLKDTVKQVSGVVVERTVDRNSLRAVQTPQVFESSLIRAALQSALDDGAAVTDDCSAVERLGMKVSLVEGSEYNMKLTTPVDMLFAECILNEGSCR